MRDPNSNSRNEESASYSHYAELAQRVQESLAWHLKSLSITNTGLGLVLQGECDSYHAKQMAEELVIRYTSERILENNLVVTSGPRCDE